MHTGFFRRFLSKRSAQAAFEAQYRAGAWNYLGGMAELSRYSIITGYCHRLRAKTILDVGCGHGALAQSLKPLTYERYLGIDFSPEAIRRAVETQADLRTRFAVAEGAGFEPAERFDTIIFNECLYYLDDPETVVRSYARALSPKGRFIVSIHKTLRNWRTWPAIEKVLVVQDCVTVTNLAKTAWTIKVLVPRT